MKIILSGITTLLILSLLNSQGFADDTIEPPRVHEQTLSEYVYSGDSNWDMKLRMSAYIDTLILELDSLKSEIENEMTALTPALLTEFREAHETFLAHAKAWSQIQEDIVWSNLETGELYIGSGYGYIYGFSYCEMIWQRILSYRGFLDEVHSQDYDGFAQFPCEFSEETGGY